MKKYLGGLALVAFAALYGCAQGESQIAPAAGKITNIEVYTVVAEDFTEYVTLPVVVTPYREANLSLVGGGKVTRLSVDKGDRVAAGQVLLETDTEMLDASLALAKAQLEFQQHEFARNRQLFEAGTITQAAFDVARLALAQAQAQYDISRKQRADAVLKAPFNGIITSRNAELGDVLAPGTPAFRLIDIERVKVQAGIPERLIKDFREGSTVSVEFDAIPGSQFDGRLDYLAPEASTRVRTFLAEIVIDNRDRAIRAGLMGNVRIQRRTFADALLIPLDALIESQSGRKVFVVHQDSLAAERSIDIGGGGEDMIVALSGLQAGERVIARGQHDLVDGDQVRITGQYQRAVHREVRVQ